MTGQRLSRSEAAFVIGVPLASAGGLLFHPSGEVDQIYLSLRDDVTAWLVVHIGMMLFIPLMAGGIYLLLRGVEGTAAQVKQDRACPLRRLLQRVGDVAGHCKRHPRERTEPAPGTGACSRVKVDSGLRGESLGPRSRRLREYRKRLDRDRDDRGRDGTTSSRRARRLPSHPARLVRSPDRRPYPAIRPHRARLLRRRRGPRLAKKTNRRGVSSPERQHSSAHRGDCSRIGREHERRSLASVALRQPHGLRCADPAA